jgi:hypothetical protein
MWNGVNHVERGNPCQRPKMPRHKLAQVALLAVI